MLFITVAFFVLCLVFAKLMFLYQVAANQQLEGVIHRSAADVELLLFKKTKKALGFKVVIALVNFFEYGIALGGFAQPFPLQIGRKNVLHFLNMFFAACIHGSK